jgi:GTP:adenosylcobinamide-phosphate guanylyltransferase
MFDALVLAGGGRKEPLTEQECVSNKAFINLYGRPLLAYILQALEEASAIDRIVVVGPQADLESLRREGYNFEIVPETSTMLDNLAAGFESFDKRRLSLIVTGDIPLINASVIDKFIESCAPYDHDFYYPVIKRETCVLSFPETERTYVRLKDGHITGGNIALLKPEWFLLNRSRLEMFISYRKKPLKLMRILPKRLIVKYLFKNLSVKDLEQSLSKLLHLKARAVFSDCVEIGVDVDKISDLEVVKKALKSDL